MPEKKVSDQLSPFLSDLNPKLQVNCGGDSYFGALCNSFIHVLMYAYYLMAALKISCPWKRHLTKMQMIQFLTCIVHAGYLYIHKTVPTVLLALQVVSQEVAIRAKDECFFSSLCCLTRPSPPPPSLFFFTVHDDFYVCAFLRVLHEKVQEEGEEEGLSCAAWAPTRLAANKYVKYNKSTILGRNSPYTGAPTPSRRSGR